MASSFITVGEAVNTLTLNFAAKIPVMLMGASGIGKTELALAYAESQGDDYGLFELNCAVSSLPDVIGFMITDRETWELSPATADTDAINHEIIAAKFAYPYFMRDKRTGKPAFMFKRGMIVLEEYGQAQPDVKRALASVMWEKRVGAHKFPAACDVLILSNRPEDRSGVTKDFDFLINRRNQITIAADLDGWLVWAHANGVSNMAMAYAHRNEAKVFHNKAPEKQGPWLTPRSLVSADNFLKAANKYQLNLDDDLVRKNLGGIISDATAHDFIAFARLKDGLPTIKQIVEDPVNTNVPPEPDRQMFLVFDMASKATKATMAPMKKYLDRMYPDFAVAFFKQACTRDAGLKSSKEFGDFALKNLPLLTAVADSSRR